MNLYRGGKSMSKGVEYDKLKYYILGLMVGSDPRLFTGSGSTTNKVLRVEINGDKLRVARKAGGDGGSKEV